jgi:hypothetical protein
LAINTRPDIAHSVGVLAWFNKNSNFRACKAIIRLLLYLWGTADVGIQFTGKSLNLFGYSDADWAGDLDSRRSTTGYVVYAAGRPIAGQFWLQTRLRAVSTIEAEYMSAFGAIQELLIPLYLLICIMTIIRLFWYITICVSFNQIQRWWQGKDIDPTRRAAGVAGSKWVPRVITTVEYKMAVILFLLLCIFDVLCNIYFSCNYCVLFGKRNHDSFCL